MDLRLTRFHRVGAAVHAVALSADAQHLLIGSEHGLQLVDRRGHVQQRLGEGAFSAVALALELEAGRPSLGLAMERKGRLLRLEFKRQETESAGRPLRVAAVGIWEQQDDLYSLDYAPQGSEGGLIALGHHARGLAALDGSGKLLWRLGPAPHETGARDAMARRTWQAAISPDGRTIYATALGGQTHSARPGAEIVTIDAAIGKAVRSVAIHGRATLLAGLPNPLGVAAVVHDMGPSGACCSVLGFDPALREVAWTLRCPAGVMVTAAASAVSQAALVLGTNTGELWRVGAFTGRVLARYDLLFASTVLSVAVAESGEIAAGLANGHIAFLERVTDEERRTERE